MEFGLALILFVGLIVICVLLLIGQHFKAVRNQRKETLK